MKEKELIDLGFKKEVEDSSGEDNFYYFIYEFGDRYSLALISSASDEVKDKDSYLVEIFNENDYSFSDISEVKLFIDILKRNKK